MLVAGTGYRPRRFDQGAQQYRGEHIGRAGPDDTFVALPIMRARVVAALASRGLGGFMDIIELCHLAALIPIPSTTSSRRSRPELRLRKCTRFPGDAVCELASGRRIFSGRRQHT